MKHPAPARPSPANVSPQWAWHYQTLSRLRDSLVDRRGPDLSAVRTPSAEDATDMADRAVGNLDNELSLGMLSLHENALHEVESALQRIANGTYGICEDTGTPIPGARLGAVPWTRYCREAVERREHEAAERFAHPGAPGRIFPLPQVPVQKKSRRVRSRTLPKKRPKILQS